MWEGLFAYEPQGMWMGDCSVKWRTEARVSQNNFSITNRISFKVGV